MTALLEYIDFFVRFLLAVFDVALLNEFSCDTAGKFVNFKTIIPEYYYGIIPDSFYHPLSQKLFQHNVHMRLQFMMCVCGFM